jgi:hypothetical protein
MIARLKTFGKITAICIALYIVSVIVYAVATAPEFVPASV